MKYSYTPTASVDFEGRFIKRPIIEIELRFGGKKVGGLGLIDSGADATLINIEYARYLGITLDTKRRYTFTGIANERVNAHIHEVTIAIKDLLPIITIPVAFVESKAVDILLGQKGFFDAFHIKFEKDRDTFEIIAPRRKQNAAAKKI